MTERTKVISTSRSSEADIEQVNQLSLQKRLRTPPPEGVANASQEERKLPAQPSLPTPKPPRKPCDSRFLQQRWIIGHVLGRGASGIVCQAFDTQTQQYVAIKADSNRIGTQTILEREYKVYHKLFGDETAEGFIRPISFFKTARGDFMVLPRLGKTMEQIYREDSDEFDFMSVCELGIQMLSRLEHLHNRGFLHLDIKPGNMMLEDRDCASTVHLIDFGFAKQYLDDEGEQIPFRADVRFVGTAMFASLHTHKGIERAPRDDLESLWYCLVLMCKNQLPWSDEGWRLRYKVLDKELNGRSGNMIAVKEMHRSDICRDMPQSFQECWRIIKDMRYCDRPNYAWLRELLGLASREYNYSLVHSDSS